MNNLKNYNGFNIEEEERSVSPEKLNEYIRIGSPGGILLIIALIIAAAALIVWGFTGSIPVTISENVAVVGAEDGTNMCVGFIDVRKNTGILPEGTEVNIRMPDGKSVKGTVFLMSTPPLSVEEIKEWFGNTDIQNIYLSDWMMDVLIGDSRYSYICNINTEEDVSEYWHQIAEATIITGEIKPVSLLMR